MKNLWGNSAWVAALYFTEGLPNVIVATVAVAYYASSGMGNSEMAFLTSLLYTPWFLKAFWGPVVDTVSGKRRWIFACLFAFLAIFALLGLSQFFGFALAASSVLFLALGFASATFDIASDGFYMLALAPREQSFFVGFRNAFYRIAAVVGQGGVLFVAGRAEKMTGSNGLGWAVAFASCALLIAFVLPFVRLTLPDPERSSAVAANADAQKRGAGAFFADIFGAFAQFFKKRHLASILLFVLFYRFAEAQLTKLVQPFMFADTSAGGLGMDKEDVALVYGSLAPVLLLGGGILGGFIVAKTGLRRVIFIMAAAMNLPDLIYVYMARAQPQSLLEIGALVGLEQFGYGFGFAGYMVYLLFVSNGKNRTSSYAICTSLMALGIIVPGAFSGEIQEYLGYVGFFDYAMACTAVSFAVTFLAYRTLRDGENAGSF